MAPRKSQPPQEKPPQPQPQPQPQPADGPAGAMAPGCEPQPQTQPQPQPLPQPQPQPAQAAAPSPHAPLLVATVGLPARGKTHCARRLARFLAWSGEAVKVFTVSDYRRRLMERYDNHNLFRADNPEALQIRSRSSDLALADAARWLAGAGTVAVLDGTHTTREQRRQLKERADQLRCRLLLLELVCDQPQLLHRNMQDVLQNSPDYKDMSPEKALADFQKKLRHYEGQLEPVDAGAEGVRVVRFCDDGERLEAGRAAGPVEARVLAFLASYRPGPKTLYFSRHGESEYNVLGRIGGDTALSARGQAYARALATKVNALQQQQASDGGGLRVWTSRLRRTRQTALGVQAPAEALAALNELDAGVCEGLTYEEIQQQHPAEFAWRDQDKLRYRYPWGESYVDVMARVQPVLLALEATDAPVLVVSHQAVLRCVLGYFLDTPPDQLPYFDVPLHTLLTLSTDGYNFSLHKQKVPVECVDTYRRQPQNCSADRSSQDALLTVPSHLDSLSLWDDKERTLLIEHQ